MKKCIDCKKELNFDSFGKVSKNKDGYSNKCKSCKREYNNNYYNNKSKLDKIDKYHKQQKRIIKNKQFIYDYLKNNPCKECGESRVVCLDFNHLENKNFGISDGVNKGYSLNKLKEEIKKCEVLCSNCHRVFTSKQLNWYKELNI